MIDLYTELAKGGVGLIITGAVYVQQNSRHVLLQGGISSDEHIEGWKKLVDEVHKLDTKISPQICHAGRQTVPELIGETPMAPSAIGPDPFLGTSPREMTTQEIQETIDAFGESARRTKEAGFDGVQLMVAHGQLIAQFLSPHTNKRTDEWGGTLSKRMKFVEDVYGKVREAVGKDYPVMIKLSVEDGLEDGITLDESSKIAKRLSEFGIDAIEISGGTIVDTAFMICRGDIPLDIFTRGREPEEKKEMEQAFYSIKDTVKFEEAYWLSHASKIKGVIGGVPLMLVGGMKYPQTMEKILEEGKADLISMCRPLIKEPNLPNEIKEGRKSPVKCAFCNRCLGEVTFSSNPLKCYN